jgi:very-long-chain (3R)-3-hydroxyacyl-CoA dehydratase
LKLGYQPPARYNTFYVLYPIGISSECILIWKALKPAVTLHPLYQWFLVAMLVIYVPGTTPLLTDEIGILNGPDQPNHTGSYIMYTHMIAQRQRVRRGKNRVS